MGRKVQIRVYLYFVFVFIYFNLIFRNAILV